MSAESRSSVTLTPIAGLRRDHPTDSAPRIGRIASVSGDDVDVSVHHRLSCRLPVVDSDVEAVWMMFCYQLLLGVSDQSPQRCLIIGRKFEETSDMLPGNNQGVALAHRESVGEGDADCVLQPDLSGC